MLGPLVDVTDVTVTVVSVVWKTRHDRCVLTVLREMVTDTTVVSLISEIKDMTVMSVTTSLKTVMDTTVVSLLSCCRYYEHNGNVCLTICSSGAATHTITGTRFLQYQTQGCDNKAICVVAVTLSSVVSLS